MGLVIRRARPDEADALTRLAVRSKAHWGYDDAFMRTASPDLQMTADRLASTAAYAAEQDGAIAGFYVLSAEPEGPTLSDLWIDPARMGAGVGARLYRHMLQTARALGYAVVRIESDPHAEGFYLKMGAVRVGVVPSRIAMGGAGAPPNHSSGPRMLPLLEARPAQEQSG
jgi:GNAT superfamily N-acetyltransferase